MVIATSCLLGLLVLGILVLVIRGARQTRSMRDYAVGSMQFSPVFVGLSLAASITSAATFIINPGFIALYGISGVVALGIVLPIGLYLSLIILTKSFRKYGQSVKALTMAQWIGQRYKSKPFAFFFAVAFPASYQLYCTDLCGHDQSTFKVAEHARTGRID